MGLDLWFREDVARILAALARTAARARAGEYQQGYIDALGDVAASFGIVAPENHQVPGGEWIGARPVVEVGYRVGEVLPD